MTEVFLLVILALDSHIGTRALAECQCGYPVPI